MDIPRYLLIASISFLVLLLIVSPAETQETITFHDGNWESLQVHNRIAGFIIEHGYGYDVSFSFAETMPGLLGLRRGDIDVGMEMWVETFHDAYKEALEEEELIDLGRIFPDSPQGWYVPTYVIEGDSERDIEPMAPELESVFDLPEYSNLFEDPVDPDRGRFYNGPAGWVAHEYNLEKLETYGLDEYYSSFDPGSQMALDSAIVSAYEDGEPILFYYWEPTWVMGLYDMTMLEEPNYSREQWNEDRGCAYPVSRVQIAVHRSLPGRAPELISFLSNYETTLDQNNKMLAYLHEHDAEPREAAIWFLDTYRETWQNWFPVEAEVIIERVENELEEEL